MNTSNIEAKRDIQKVCIVSRDNLNLKAIIKQQSNEIGKLLQEKKDLEEEYEKLLQSIDINSIVITSNIENTSNIEM